MTTRNSHPSPIDGKPVDLDVRVEGLDDDVERLTKEVVSLKLEVATLVSALRELQRHEPARAKLPRALPAGSSSGGAPRTPSLVPAAAVVLIAGALLLWQLRLPGAESIASNPPAEVAPPAIAGSAQAPPTIDDARQSTEPPLTPLVQPTIYRGTLAVNADRPGATVFVNRMPVGKAPVRLRNLRAGAHLVWVESEGFRRWTRVVTVPAERVTRVEADLEPVIEDR